MKNTLPILCALALAATLRMAGQSEDADSIQATLRRSQGEVKQQMSEAAAQVKQAQAEVATAVRQVQAEVGTAVRQAQAEVARAQAGQSHALREARETVLAAVEEAPEPPEPPEPPEEIGVSGAEEAFGFSFNNDVVGRAGGASTPLVVASGPVEEAKLAEIQEDLAVMSRILGKTVERATGREGTRTAMNITVFGQSASRLPQSEFIDGFGVLFHLSVKFPLVPPPAKEEVRKEKAEDTTWEKTKRELYGQRQVSGTGISAEMRGRYGLIRPESTGAPYDGEQVESLKKALLESLKNASNIRNVDPNGTVAIAVQGAGSAAGVRHVHTTTRSTGGKSQEKVIVSTIGGSGAGSRQSVLTLRATKSDADDYANGKLTLDEFSRKVQIRSY